MTATPYVRPGLSATQQQLADATAVIEDWIDRLDVVLSGCSGRPADQDAYDLLALWAALQRTRPELVAGLDTLVARSRAEEELRRHGSALAARVLSVLNPDAWLAEAQSFTAEAEVVEDPADLTERAVQLLTELDEAELVAWAARHFGVGDEAVEQQLKTCTVWLEEHADRFVPAGVFVQAVGLSLRPDLPAVNLELAWTADKFVILLDELEAVEAELAFAEVPPLPPTWLEVARARLRSTVRIPITAWLPPVGPTLLAAAAAAPELTSLQLLRWRSPDGRFEAALVLPERSDPLTEDAPVRLNFYQHGEPALELAGQPIRLAGVPATIDADAGALFVLARLRETGQGPVLEVGSNPWIPD